MTDSSWHRGRRLKAFHIRDEHLLTLFREPYGEDLRLRVLDADLPEDARLVALNYDHTRMALIAIVESEHFPEGVPGQIIPVIEETDVFFTRPSKDWRKSDPS